MGNYKVLHSSRPSTMLALKKWLLHDRAKAPSTFPEGKINRIKEWYRNHVNDPARIITIMKARFAYDRMLEAEAYKTAAVELGLWRHVLNSFVTDKVCVLCAEGESALHASS